MNKVRVWLAAASVAAIIGLIYASGPGLAGGGKELATSVDKVASSIKGGDTASAKKQAGAIAKKAEGMEDVMDLFKPKNKGGFGFGTNPTDGIEKKLREAARDGAKAKDAMQWEQAANRIAAIGLVTEAYTSSVKETSKKKRKDWEKFSEDMVSASQNLAKAAKSGSTADIKGAAAKVNNACNACHSIFRE